MADEQTTGRPGVDDTTMGVPDRGNEAGAYDFLAADPDLPEDPEPTDGTPTQDELNKQASFTFATDDFEPGEKVGDSRAVRLIFIRLGKLGLDRGPADNNEWRAAKAELSRKIIAMIPDDMQTDDVLKNADLRAMFNEIGFGERDKTEADSEVAGMKFSALERTIAGEALIQAQTKITAQYEKMLIGEIPENLPPDQHAAEVEKVAQFVDNMTNEWRGGQVNRIEETIEGDRKWDSVKGEVVNVEDDEGNEASGVLEDFNAFDVEGAATESLTQFLSYKDIQRLVQSGELTMDDLNDLDTGEELGVDGKIVTGQTRIQYEDTASMSSLIRGGPDPRADSVGVLSPQGEEETKWADKEWYSVREARRLYNDMDQAEKLALTDKMKKAGLFDLVGREPVIPGDTTDPAFKAAWDHLMKSSLETGKPMTELLAERMTAFEREKEASLSTKLTDPARLRINANGYARDVIGRHMTDDEQAKMIEFMHNLERENAKVEEGLTTDDPETQLDEGTIADIDARMQEYLVDQNPTEAGAKDVADQYEQFTQMLAGPGRGVR